MTHDHVGDFGGEDCKVEDDWGYEDNSHGDPVGVVDSINLDNFVNLDVNWSLDHLLDRKCFGLVGWQTEDLEAAEG